MSKLRKWNFELKLNNSHPQGETTSSVSKRYLILYHSSWSREDTQLDCVAQLFSCHVLPNRGEEELQRQQHHHRLLLQREISFPEEGISNMATLTGNARVGEESSVVTRESMLETAQSIVEDKTINSGVIDIQLAEEVPRFQMKELRLGKILGRGAFCMAVEIDQFKIEDTYKSAGSKFFGRWKKSASREVPIKEEEDDDAGSNFGSENHGTLSSKSYIRGSFMSRDRLAKLAKKRTRKGALFAMKRVCPELQANNRTKYLQGLVDLAMEAGFLASLEHPNIVALCGVSSQGPSDFIILERLKETLSKRFKKWTQIDRQCKGITGVFTGSKKKINLLYEDKISAAFDVASAVDFLHQRNIVYRDLVRTARLFGVIGINFNAFLN